MHNLCNSSFILILHVYFQLLKTFAVLFFAAVCTALPVDDPIIPVKEVSAPHLGPVQGPEKPEGPVLDHVHAPIHGPELKPELKPEIKPGTDLKTDATSWGYYRYPYNYGYYNSG